VDELLEVAAGRTQKLAVSMPPRHGKSELVSRYLPAWWLGVKPNDRVILASYEASFAATWGAKARDALAEYGPDLFGVGVRTDSRASDAWRTAAPYEGGMFAVGEGGPLTGKGANLLILDDLVKNAEEAASEAHREHAWDWWRSTARTRLEPGGRVIAIGTRWHEDDIIGRILREAQAEGEPWRILNLPALAEDLDPLGRMPGEALWPARYDAAALDRIRREVGAYYWAAMYQGRPAPLEGGLFKRAWFRYQDPPADGLLRFAAVDLAASTKQTADYTVVLVLGLRSDGTMFVLDVIRRRLEGPEIISTLKATCRKHGLVFVGVEKAGFQLALIQIARAEGIPVRELEADKDKVARALAATPFVEAGRVIFPKAAPWLGELEQELLGFPNATHDDQVDALAYAVRLASQMLTLYDPVPPAQRAQASPIERNGLRRPEGWR
jgi:predicted phage terminase large subunit-like protein